MSDENLIPDAFEMKEKAEAVQKKKQDTLVNNELLRITKQIEYHFGECAKTYDMDITISNELERNEDALDQVVKSLEDRNWDVSIHSWKDQETTMWIRPKLNFGLGVKEIQRPKTSRTFDVIMIVVLIGAIVSCSGQG